MVWNMLWVSLGQLSWFCPLPAPGGPSSPLVGRAAWKAETSLSLCKRCSTTTKTLVCYHPHFHQKIQNTALYEALQRKLTQSQAKSWHNDRLIYTGNKWKPEEDLQFISSQLLFLKLVRDAFKGPDNQTMVGRNNCHPGRNCLSKSLIAIENSTIFVRIFCVFVCS